MHAFNRIERTLLWAPFGCSSDWRLLLVFVCRRCKLFFIQLTPLLQPSRSHWGHRWRQDVCVCWWSFHILAFVSWWCGVRHDRNRNCRHIRPAEMKWPDCGAETIESAPVLFDSFFQILFSSYIKLFSPLGLFWLKINCLTNMPKEFFNFVLKSPMFSDLLVLN